MLIGVSKGATCGRIVTRLMINWSRRNFFDHYSYYKPPWQMFALLVIHTFCWQQQKAEVVLNFADIVDYHSAIYKGPLMRKFILWSVSCIFILMIPTSTFRHKCAETLYFK